jgi:hypothetical protein
MTAQVWKSNNSVKNIIQLGQMPPKCWGPRLKPVEPIGKSGTGWPVIYRQVSGFIFQSLLFPPPINS